jgi:hypothetical protein
MLLSIVSTLGAADGTWTQLANGPWAAREGLMAVSTPTSIVMTGGRKTFGAVATNDVRRHGSRSAPTPIDVCALYSLMYMTSTH